MKRWQAQGAHIDTCSDGLHTLSCSLDDNRIQTCVCSVSEITVCSANCGAARLLMWEILMELKSFVVSWCLCCIGSIARLKLFVADPNLLEILGLLYTCDL